MLLDGAGPAGCTVLPVAAGPTVLPVTTGTGAVLDDAAAGTGAVGSAAASFGRGRGSGGGPAWLMTGAALAAGVRVGATGVVPTEAT